VILLNDIEYHEPQTLDEAISLRSQLGPDALIYAGGTDIIPKIRYGRITPAHLVNIKRISGLDRIGYENGLHIGALATFNDICSHDAVRQHYPVLVEVFGDIASHQVRNLATIGGNICNAAPSADSAPILMTMDARVEISGIEGKRTMLLEEFFRGPGEVDLEHGDILTGIIVPTPAARTGYAYIKHTVRKSLDIAIVGVAVAVTLDDAGMCSDARVVIGASAPVPLRINKAEEALMGTSLNENDVKQAGQLAVGAVRPIDDVRRSAAYRRDMADVILARAVKKAGGDALE